VRKLKTGAAALVLALALGVFTAGGALAAITPVDISCTNNGGQMPPGQQPTCTGGGLTQQSENQNPAGHAPPGQNK
jgi:hypothetical protein